MLGFRDRRLAVRESAGLTLAISITMLIRLNGPRWPPVQHESHRISLVHCFGIVCHSDSGSAFVADCVPDKGARNNRNEILVTSPLLAALSDGFVALEQACRALGAAVTD